ncbi:MAG: hypothetical protein KDD48_01625 [Bdellovibrionales bacterium]|nr:hypothetical protein [Bdellovibrionales bacterium]
MTVKESQILAGVLLLSLALGFFVIIFGSTQRSLPPSVDVVWSIVDKLHDKILNQELTFKNNSSYYDEQYDGYRVFLTHLKKDAYPVERYILKIESTYQLMPTTLWEPSSWIIGFVAHGNKNNRRVHLVTSRKLKE